MPGTRDPFAPQPEEDVLSQITLIRPDSRGELTELKEEDIFYHLIDSNGSVAKYKNESGVPVKVADLGSIKDYFQTAINKAALLSPRQMANLDFSDMSHLEIAAVRVAAYAAAGDLKSAQELFDRIAGKAKLVTESTQLNLTIDDVLMGVKPRDNGVIDV